MYSAWDHVQLLSSLSSVLLGLYLEGVMGERVDAWVQAYLGLMLYAPIHPFIAHRSFQKYVALLGGCVFMPTHPRTYGKG